MSVFRSLRSRLTFWYAFVLLAGLALFAGWMEFSVHRYIASNADDRLTRRLRGLRSAFEEESNESFNVLREELREFSIESPEGELTAVRGRGGREILRAAGIPEDLLWQAPIDHPGDLFSSPT